MVGQKEEMVFQRGFHPKPDQFVGIFFQILRNEVCEIAQRLFPQGAKWENLGKDMDDGRNPAFTS